MSGCGHVAIPAAGGLTRAASLVPAVVGLWMTLGGIVAAVLAKAICFAERGLP